MMQPSDNRGGYRRPSNPAPVSGPGALSARTDGGPAQTPMRYPDTTYGEGGYVEQQQGAEMAAGPAMPAPEMIDLTAPTQFTEQPISFGSSWGAGPGPSIVTPQPVSMRSTLEKALQYDQSGIAEFLYNRMNK